MCWFSSFFICTVEKKKDTTTTVDKQKIKEKKVGVLDEQLKQRNRDMSMIKFKSMFFTTITIVAVFGMLSNL